MSNPNSHDSLAPRWHHRPAHLFVPDTAYMVTAGTLHKEHLFRTDDRLKYLHDMLHELAERYQWELQAWAVFSNHYHWIANSPGDPKTLRKFASHLHTNTAAWVNRLDSTPGRKVWFEFRDTCLTFESSYFARLNYVNQNPVHHGIVPVADQYAYGSARWFATQADPSFRGKVESYKFDNLNVEDDF